MGKNGHEVDVLIAVSASGLSWRAGLRRARPGRGVLEKVTEEDRDALWRALDLLDNEYRQRGEVPSEIHVDVLRHLVSVIAVRLSHLRGEVGRGDDV